MNPRHDTTFTIAPDHPALPGHFPGQPVVPGVLLLDRVVTLARDAFDLPPATSLPRVKFAAPVLPGQRVNVALTRLAGARITFACAVAGDVVCSGELRFDP